MLQVKCPGRASDFQKKKKKRWCMRWWKRRLQEKDENVFALLGKHSKGYKYKEDWSHSGALQRLKQFVLSYWWFKKCFIFPGHKSTQITRFINLKLSHLLQLVKPSCCRSFVGFKTSEVTRKTVMLREKSKNKTYLQFEGSWWKSVTDIEVEIIASLLH